MAYHRVCNNILGPFLCLVNETNVHIGNPQADGDPADPPVAEVPGSAPPRVMRGPKKRSWTTGIDSGSCNYFTKGCRVYVVGSQLEL